MDEPQEITLPEPALAPGAVQVDVSEGQRVVWAMQERDPTFSPPAAGPLTITGTATDGTTTWDLAGTLTPRVAPDPPAPVLQSLTLAQSTVEAGSSTTGTVTLSAPAISPVVIQFQANNPSVAVPTTITLPAGMTSAPITVAVNTLLSVQATVTLTASFSGKTLSATLTAKPKPAPQPTNRINVLDKGLKGDGTTDNTGLLAALVEGAPAGAELYFPPGNYRLSAATSLRRSNISFVGEGDGSRIIAPAGALLINARNLSGIRFASLQIEGQPGRYMADGNGAGAIAVWPTNTVLIERVLFRGSGGCYSADTGPATLSQPTDSWPVTTLDCRVQGWGVNPFGLRGGERVERCQLIQDDPDRLGERSSHGFYLVGGTKNVIIRDCLIRGCRKWSVQIWNQYAGTQKQNILVERVTLEDCAKGMNILNGTNDNCLPGTNVQVRGCTIKGIYVTPGLWANNGIGLRIEGNRFEDCIGCIQIDGPVPELKDSVIAGNTFVNSKVGMVLVRQNPGLSNVVVGPNTYQSTGADIRQGDMTGFVFR